MRRNSYLFSLIAALVLAAGTAHSSNDSNNSTNIVGGTVAKKGDPLAKFTAEIIIEGPKGSGRYSLCSGTLITQNIVLTAAHCMVGEDERMIPNVGAVTVLFNRFENEFLDMRASAKVKANMVIIDRDYLGDDDVHTDQDFGIFSRKNHDVALVRLAKDAPSDFAPIHLARSSEIDTYADTLRIAGYGREADTDDGLVGRLKSASVEMTSNGFYWAKVSSVYGNGLGCHGDSGGPLLIKTPKEGYKLAGVHNTGTAGCLGSNNAARIAEYGDFLAKAMIRMGSSSANLFTAAAPANPLEKIIPKSWGSIWPSSK